MSAVSAPPPTLREVEDADIASVRARCLGNRSEAARQLGISREGLRVRLHRLGPPAARARAV